MRNWCTTRDVTCGVLVWWCTSCCLATRPSVGRVASSAPGLRAVSATSVRWTCSPTFRWGSSSSTPRSGPTSLPRPRISSRGCWLKMPRRGWVPTMWWTTSGWLTTTTQLLSALLLRSESEWWNFIICEQFLLFNYFFQFQGQLCQTTVAVCRVCSCSEPCSAAAHVCQHPARQLCSTADVSGSDGRTQSSVGVDDDAAEEKFAAVGQPLAPAEQTEQQQQGLIHPGN